MRKFRTLLGVGIAGACAVAGLPAVALAAPTAPYTALTIDLGEHRAFPALKSAAYEKSNANMGVLNQVDKLFVIEANNQDAADHARLTAEPPAGQDWVAGQTYPAALAADAGHARLDLSSNDRHCSAGTGSITVRDVAWNPDAPLVTAFAASYEFHCDGDPKAITGEVRFNSSLDYVAPVPEPSTLDFGRLDLGDAPTKSVIVRSRGSVPVTFGAASLGGAAPDDFEIVYNYCANRTIPVGNGCAVVVRPKPKRGGFKNASIYLPADTAAGRVAIPVTAEVVEGAKGTYYPVAPARLMDTRSGLGAPKGKLGQDKTVNLQVTGRGGVPTTGVGAVVLNVTVTGPTMNSFLTAYPTGEARPTASSINFAKDWLGSNNVTVKLGADGKVSIYNRNGATDVVVDVVGFYAGATAAPPGLRTGGQYQWFEPYRILDTRTTGKGPVPAGYAVTGWVDFKPDVFGDFNSHVKALVLNITAVSPQRAGFLTAWSGDGTKPVASTVNYGAGKVVPNLAYVQTVPCASGSCGGATGAPRYRIYTSAAAHVVVDLVGVMDDGTVADGLRFRPASPRRIVDSRIGQGLGKALGPGETGTVTLNKNTGEVDDLAQVLAMNVTAVAPEKNTVITVWPAGMGIAKPMASNLNPAPGQIVSNGVLGVIGPNDAFHVHNLTGTTPLVADVVGSFYLYPATAGTTTGTALAAGASKPTVAGAGSSAYVR